MRLITGTTLNNKVLGTDNKEYVCCFRQTDGKFGFQACAAMDTWNAYPLGTHVKIQFHDIQLLNGTRYVHIVNVTTYKPFQWKELIFPIGQAIQQIKWFGERLVLLSNNHALQYDFHSRELKSMSEETINHIEVVNGHVVLFTNEHVSFLDEISIPLRHVVTTSTKWVQNIRNHLYVVVWTTRFMATLQLQQSERGIQHPTQKLLRLNLNTHELIVMQRFNDPVYRFGMIDDERFVIQNQSGYFMYPDMILIENPGWMFHVSNVAIWDIQDSRLRRYGLETQNWEYIMRLSHSTYPRFLTPDILVTQGPGKICVWDIAKKQLVTEQQVDFTTPFVSDVCENKLVCAHREALFLYTV